MNVQTKEINKWNDMFEKYVNTLKMGEGDKHFILSLTKDFKTFVENRVK